MEKHLKISVKDGYTLFNGKRWAELSVKEKETVNNHLKNE